MYEVIVNIMCFNADVILYVFHFQFAMLRKTVTNFFPEESHYENLPKTFDFLIKCLLQ